MEQPQGSRPARCAVAARQRPSRGRSHVSWGGQRVKAVHAGRIDGHPRGSGNSGHATGGPSGSCRWL